jgi:hypothetical protein
MTSDAETGVEIYMSIKSGDLDKDAILSGLMEGLYRIPFPLGDTGEMLYPVEVRRIGKDGLEVEVSSGSVFKLKIE